MTRIAPRRDKADGWSGSPDERYRAVHTQPGAWNRVCYAGSMPARGLSFRGRIRRWYLLCALGVSVQLCGLGQPRFARAQALDSPGQLVAETPVSAAPPPLPGVEPAFAPSTPAEAQTPGATASPRADEPQRDDRPPPNRGADYDFGPDDVCPFCALTPQFPEGRRGLHWHEHWQPVGTREYIVAPVLGATGLAIQLLISPDDHSNWDGPILFDGAVRDALRLDSASSRDTARALSDVLLSVSFAQPMLFDTFVVAWWQKQSPRVAWQMFVINSQAYALTFTLNAATKRLTSRARPWVAGCDADPTGESCGTGGAYSSFYSGHAAMTATGAGLVCAHHTQLSLYRNNVLDSGSCLVAIAGTAVTGAMRIAADNHWSTDVLMGHFMGYLSGYLLPTLLYYKEFRITPHEDPAPGGEAPVLAVLPLITDSSAQAVVVGAW